MGFDLFGIEPRNRKGEYFRNNIWWWPRLWDFCCDITPEISENDRNSGYYNSGLVISEKKHRALIENLKKALNDREKFNEWMSNSEARYANTGHWLDRIFGAIKGLDDEAKVRPKEARYHFDWSNVEDFLEFITNNNGFQIC